MMIIEKTGEKPGIFNLVKRSFEGEGEGVMLSNI